MCKKQCAVQFNAVRGVRRKRTSFTAFLFILLVVRYLLRRKVWVLASFGSSEGDTNAVLNWECPTGFFSFGEIRLFVLNPEVARGSFPRFEWVVSAVMAGRVGGMKRRILGA